MDHQDGASQQAIREITRSRNSNFANIAHDIVRGGRSTGYAANSEPIASAMLDCDPTRHNRTGYGQVMKTRITVLGAGFGGLDLSARLSESMGEQVDVTLIDKSDAFVFGYSKLDVMVGRTTLDAVRLPSRNFLKPGVRFLQQTVTSNLGVPKHRAPTVVEASGMAKNGWVPVNPRTLETGFAGCTRSVILQTPERPRRVCSPRAQRAPLRLR